MKTYPLSSLTIEEAVQKQFKLVDCITQEFDGNEVLSLGDLGVVKGLNKPRTALKVEHVLSNFFGTEATTLVRGAGTSALRFCLLSVTKPGSTILVHDAPIYPTTEISIDSLSLQVVRCNFNQIETIHKAINELKIGAVLVQATRQKIDDSYNIKEVIIAITSVSDIPIIVDDNYAVMKTEGIGTEFGATLSAFSAFKLLGPEGVGVITGSKQHIEKIEKMNYSGGSKVQGYEAMEVLRGMVYAPVMLAISAAENEKLVSLLQSGVIPAVKNVFLANAQSKVLLVEFNLEIAEAVLAHAVSLGAAPHPVGAESKYEIAPMFYRVSGTFIKADPSLSKRMIRINPNRSGAETILRILTEAIALSET